MAELLVQHESRTEATRNHCSQLLGKRVLRLVAPPQSHLLEIAESMREIDNSFRVIDSPNLMPESDDFELGDVATFAVVTESPAWIDALSREFSIGSPGYLAQLTEAWETIRWIKAEAEHNPWALQLIDNNFHDPNEAASSIIEITTNGGPLNRDLVRTIQRMLVSVESMSPFVNELYYQKINEEVEKS